MNRTPCIVIPDTSKRDQGYRAQRANIQAAKAVSDIVRTTLGPRSMVKMLLDPLGGIVLTTDGNAVLREIDVGHPAAKSLVNLSRAQDEEIGDGTTSVVLLAGEILALCEPLFESRIHLTQIVNGLFKAYESTLKLLDEIAVPLDISNENAMQEAINTCLKTKFSARWGDLLPKIAMRSVKLIEVKLPNDKKNIDIKKYVRIEKIPGDNPEDTKIIEGLVINKDVTHPRMPRKIVNPKILLMDSPLEYKKGESQTNVEITDECHWEELLKQEEYEIKQMCDHIIKSGCNLVLTEKGVSDLAQHFLLKAGIGVIRRVKKSENNRLAKITGATIISRPSEIQSEDIGTDCGLFEIKKIGDEYYSFFTECKNPGACTILLRGGSKDVLNEIERNLHDILHVARNLILEPKLLPGGGATEMELSARLKDIYSTVHGEAHWAFNVLGEAMEVIPRTLIQNCGGDVIRTMTQLRSKHTTRGNTSVGIDGTNGKITAMESIKIWDAYSTKAQAIKSAVEAATMLLRIDDILSASNKKKNGEAKVPNEVAA